jgi:hypothetical protein
VLGLLLVTAACGQVRGGDSDRADQTSRFPADFVSLVADSSLIARVRIVALGESTEPPLVVGVGFDLERAAVVDFEASFAGIDPGSRGTVVFREPADLAEGDELFVFSRLLLAGETLVVEEVGHMSAADVGDDEFADAVDETNAFLDQRALFELMSGAQAVIVGRVATIRDLPGPIGDIPDWQQATVTIKSIVRGEPGAAVGAGVLVRFDSNDVIARPSPKLVRSQIRLLALVPDELSGVDGNAFVLSTQDEVRPAKEADAVAALLVDPPRPPDFD